MHTLLFDPSADPPPSHRPRPGLLRCSALAGAGAFTALSLGLPMTAAVAATATTTIGISAVVQATCVISAAPLVFGT